MASGLARFFAKPRALLVSHWYVGSDAAVKLMRRTFAELNGHPAIGRAEAVRKEWSARSRAASDGSQFTLLRATNRRHATTSALRTSRPTHRLCNVFIAPSSRRGQ